MLNSGNDFITFIARQLVKAIHTIEGISEYRLDNGLQVLLIPDASRSLVTVNLTVFVGSRHEGYGEAGMAHLLEHMLFKGTPTHRNIPELMNARGADFNGTTWLDRTNYYETLPAVTDEQAQENLHFALALESDRLVNSTISAEDFASEMTVVRNEFERGENNSRRILSQRVQSVAYDWHNYGRTTIGNQSDIERVPVEKLRAFYRKFYRPDNCLLVVAGKFDVEDALTAIEGYFGSLSVPEEPLDSTYTTEPAQDGERTVVLRRVGNTQYVCTSYHVPCGANYDFAAVEILAYIFGAEPTGRLYQSLVIPKLATSTASSSYGLHDPGAAKFEAQVPVDHSIEAAQEALLRCVEGVADQPITEEELKRAKSQFLKDRKLRANNSTVIAIDLSEWAAQGDWRLYLLFRDYVERLTCEDCTAAAIKYFTRNNRTLGLFIPSESAQRVEMPARPDLDVLLKDYAGREDLQEGESFDPDLIAIESLSQRGELQCGLRRVMLPKKTRGAVFNVELNLRYGTEQALAGLVEATEFLPEMLLRGTRKLNYQELQDRLDDLGAHVDTSGATGLLSVSMEATRPRMAEVMELVSEIVRYPSFDESEFEVMRRQAIASTESRMHEPNVLATIAVRRAISPFQPSDVRYIPTLEQRIERYQRLTIDKLHEVHSTMLSSQFGELAIVGDIDGQEIEALMQNNLSGWSTSLSYQRIAQPAFVSNTGSYQEIVTPDKRNAVYYAGMQIPMRDDDEDYPALVIGNYILGGSALASRLGDRVRKMEGLSYSVGSGMHAHSIDRRANFSISAIMSPDQKERLIQIIAEELNRLLADGITESELVAAKTGYLQSEQLGRTSDENVVSLLAGTLFAKRDMSYHAAFESAIADLTCQQVDAALQKHLRPEKLHIVVAGDF